MKELPVTPGRRVMCPEECRYRSKRAPFCGYCLPEVMKKLERESCGYCMLEILNRKEEAQNGEHNKKTDGNASEEGHRY